MFLQEFSRIVCVAGRIRICRRVSVPGTCFSLSFYFFFGGFEFLSCEDRAESL